MAWNNKTQNISLCLSIKLLSTYSDKEMVAWMLSIDPSSLFLLPGSKTIFLFIHWNSYLFTLPLRIDWVSYCQGLPSRIWQTTRCPYQAHHSQSGLCSFLQLIMEPNKFRLVVYLLPSLSSQFYKALDDVPFWG